MTKTTNSPISDLIQTVHRLRAPDGCPWDKEQTHQSIRQYLIEEAYEVLDVLDKIHSPEDLKKEDVKNAFREELGDLLMQVLLHSEIASEQRAFDIFDVARALNEKLVRRHPHVFGDVKADSAESAFKSWERQKAKEKSEKPGASVLDGVPKGLPALQRVSRVIEKVTKVGFQWKDLQGPLEKVEEELNELKAEIPVGDQSKIEHELGDLFFTICNLAFLTKIDPEAALRGTLSRFEKRFGYVETKLMAQGKAPENSTLEEMDKLWDEAKSHEKNLPR